MNNMTIEIDPSLIQHAIEKGKRLDGRTFDAYRQIMIETNVVTSAEGSARVRIGNTEVLAGVKMSVGDPFSDTPNEGVLMVGAELVPLASPRFESGPPGEEAIEMARVVDRAIRESHAIDFEKLCIKEGEKTWIINVDIDILDDDGNLIDACGIAAISALLTVKIPEINEDFKILQDRKGTQKLPIKGIPVSTTVVKILNKLVFDPTYSETCAIESRLTVGTIDEDKEIKVCSFQKGGSYGLTPEEIDEIVEIATEKSKEIRQLIKQHV